MKLRIRGNSIRLRLSRSEVERLARYWSVSDGLELGGGSDGFHYALRITAEKSEARVTYKDHRLTVSIPAGEAERWITTGQVGIEAIQETDDHKFFRILVEKDFACLAERAGEDDTDAFPNPFLGRVEC